MPSQPVKHNAQRQRLTVTLKNLCRDYPAGGGVLRELLQNADDAKARNVKFYLDERSYPLDPLFNKVANKGQNELQKFQGPALLAFNDAIFTEKDFTSLSQLGESLKIDDGTTTGRFGRGFNTVYNWTDSPSIVSREFISILDPHERWSEGGPRYDFVQGSKEEDVSNHMSAFQALIEDTTKPLEGTIIRVPLRTTEQALDSEISDKNATVSEVLEVLQKFAAEFGKSGLVFMKNVELITIGSTNGPTIEISVINSDDVRSNKTKVNDAIRTSLQDPKFNFDLSFEITLQLKTPQESKQTSFAVHHRIMCKSMDKSMRKWADREKLAPWVAVAAPLQETDSAPFQGSLYAVLPLPIPIEQPVHIHGLFSLSPDRARLVNLSDSSITDKDPANWNNWLFREQIPVVWTRLLEHLARNHPSSRSFQQWPRSPTNPHDPLNNCLQDVIKIIAEGDLCVWPTIAGHKTVKDSLLDTKDISPSLRNAFVEAMVPIIYSNGEVRNRIKHLFVDRELNASQVCTFLKDKEALLQPTSSQSKVEILDYLLRGARITSFSTLPLFPLKNGTFTSADLGDLRVDRCDNLEEALFMQEKDHTIDLSMLSQSSSLIDMRCKEGTFGNILTFRSEHALKDYFLKYISPNSSLSDVISLDANALAFASESAQSWVSKAWKWIAKYCVNIDIISDIWLIPIANEKYRKIVPRHATSEAIHPPADACGTFMRALDHQSSFQTLLIDTNTTLDVDMLTLLKGNPKFRVQDGGDLVDFASWLGKLPTFVNPLPEDAKESIIEFLHQKLRELSIIELRRIAKSLQYLEIFRKLVWKTKGEHATLSQAWTSMSAYATSLAVSTGFAIPELENVQFLSASGPISKSHFEIIQNLNLCRCLEVDQIVQDYIIPAWNSPQASSWRFSSSFQQKLQYLPIVPIQKVNGTRTSNFGCSSRLIDHLAKNIVSLFFEDEEVLPCDDISRKPSVRHCGLKMQLDQELVVNRVKFYSSCDRQPARIHRRISKMIRSQCSWLSDATNSNDVDIQTIRTSKWLPVIDDGIMVLKAPNECRSRRDILLISSVMPTLNVVPLADWMTRLGWNETIPKDILVRQLTHGIKQKQLDIVDAVLSYIMKNGGVELWKDDLISMSFVPTTSSYLMPCQVFSPAKILFTRCEKLEPYLGNVQQDFWDKHEECLKALGIANGPTLADLTLLLDKLSSKAPIGEADARVAAKALKIASLLPRSSLVGIKVICDDGHFSPIEDVCFGQGKASQIIEGKKVNFTHAFIQKETIQKLGIEALSDKLFKGSLDLADDDDEEDFEQQEKTTTRIVDTLERYPIASTFTEYLANADDTKGVKAIKWLLDARTHGHEKLLTPELKDSQGPALLVYNDGVFSDDDFKGFKNVGEGSKRSNDGVIGQFGRGSQTMYHWTDTPMVLSGSWLIILDPQQKLLPKSTKTGRRKLGIRILISKLRSLCPDQLAPFNALFDFDWNIAEYNGTIFRFPLRPLDSKSQLRTGENKITVDNARVRLMKYFEDAKIQLLYLRQVLRIEFRIFDSNDCEWYVSRQEPSDLANDVTKVMIITHCQNPGSDSQLLGEDRYFVYIEDIDAEASILPSMNSRVMKNLECGFAALVSSTINKFSMSSGIGPRIFSTLPLPLLSDLPLFVHATFSIAGDRASLVLGESGQSHGATWNNHLLQKVLPRVLLDFLECLAMHIGQPVFDFWPKTDLSPSSCLHPLCAAFQKLLLSSEKRLYPAATIESGRRRKRNVLDSKSAVFDFLSEPRSSILAPLLFSLNANIVRGMPDNVITQIKNIPGVNTISAPWLRNLLKTDEGRLKLQEHTAADPNLLEVVLNFILGTEDGIEELDGCHIAPLSNGSLGTLRLLSSSDSIPAYYVVLESEKYLFKFASSIILSRNSNRLIAKLLVSKKFKLQKLDLHHVTELMALREAIPCVTPESDKWLSKFWVWWNNGAEKLAINMKDEKRIVSRLGPVFRCTIGSFIEYRDYEELSRLPIIFAPTLDCHSQLCQKIPGLIQLDHDYMPKSWKTSEGSVSTSGGFSRFFRAIQSLAREIGISPADFISTHLDNSNLELLRSIIVDVLTTKREQGSTFIEDFKPMLSSIPLWKCASSQSDYSPASTVLVPDSEQLMVPWMKNYNRFINTSLINGKNRCCLKELGAQIISRGSLINEHIFPLPNLDENGYWDLYAKLIGEIAKTCQDPSQADKVEVTILKQNKIAANRQGIIVKAADLFDHAEQIFISAFRGQEDSKFLHDDLRLMRQFWSKVGLRSKNGGQYSFDDYLECLQALSERLGRVNHNIHDQELSTDVEIILGPLTEFCSSTNSFSPHEWNELAKMKVFLSRRASHQNPPQHGINTMRYISRNTPIISLSELVLYDHVSVCWSQTPFATLEPTREVLSCIRGDLGRPPIQMVWKHLEHLRSMAPTLTSTYMSGFVEDLHATYTYLQDNFKTSCQSFQPEHSDLWLNISVGKGQMAILHDVRSCWVDLKRLVLSTSCDNDYGEIQAIRPSLAPYEKLLGGLGCKAIVYPTVTMRTIQDGPSMSTRMRYLRAAGTGLDITFRAEGKKIRAHRIVLATVSSYCAKKCEETWRHEDTISFDESADSIIFIPFHTLSVLIDFAYEETIDWAGMEVVPGEDAETIEEKLRLLLNLLGGSEYWGIDSLKAQAEQKVLLAAKMFINIGNVVEVKERAEQSRSSQLATFCSEFIRQNAEAVEGANVDGEYVSTRG